MVGYAYHRFFRGAIMLRVDSGLFTYTKGGMGEGRCQFDVFLGNGRWLVLFTELKSNTGPSVTNSVEHIVPQFCEQTSLPIDEVDFAERSQYDSRSIDQILIRGARPTWKRMNPDRTQEVLAALDLFHFGSYSLSIVPPWCGMADEDHLDTVGGCWGLSTGGVIEKGEPYCQSCGSYQPGCRGVDDDNVV